MPTVDWNLQPQKSEATSHGVQFQKKKEVEVTLHSRVVYQKESLLSKFLFWRAEQVQVVLHINIHLSVCQRAKVD
jgi:hypothetical protein